MFKSGKKWHTNFVGSKSIQVGSGSEFSKPYPDPKIWDLIRITWFYKLHAFLKASNSDVSLN